MVSQCGAVCVRLCACMCACVALSFDRDSTFGAVLQHGLRTNR